MGVPQARWSESGARHAAAGGTRAGFYVSTDREGPGAWRASRSGREIRTAAAPAWAAPATPAWAAPATVCARVPVASVVSANAARALPFASEPSPG
jgi:hypothetical protein